MITIEKEFTYEETYPLSRLGDPKNLLFFDIETTGFSHGSGQYLCYHCRRYLLFISVAFKERSVLVYHECC